MFQICNWKYWARHTSKKTLPWWSIQWVLFRNRVRYSMAQGTKTVHVGRSSMATRTLAWKMVSRMRMLMMWAARMALVPLEVTLRMEQASRFLRKKWTISSSLATTRTTRMRAKNSPLQSIRWWAAAIIIKAGSFIFSSTYWIDNTKFAISEKGMAHSPSSKVQ